MKNNKLNIQLIWGAALLLVGVGVFIRIPQVMPKIEQIDQYASILPYIRFCFYLLGTLLVSAGVKKIFDQYKK
jgi:hypothetical protein